MEPWDRQPFDSDASWVWFVAYRDAMPPRRLDRVRVSVPGTVAPPLMDLMRWATEGHWVERVRAWDQHLDDIRQAEREAAVSKQAREAAEDQEAALAQDLRELALREAGKWVKTSAATEPEVLKPREVVAVADAAVKLGRLTRGESTEKVEVKDELNLDNLSAEELRQYRDLYLKARGVQGR